MVSSSPSSITLLLGDDAALVEEEIARVDAAVFKDPEARRMNRLKAAADEGPIAEVLAFASTAPFLAPRRLVVLSRVERLADDDRAALLALLAAPSFAVWVLVSETKPSKSAFVADLAKLSRVVRCEPPRDDREVRAWINRRFGLLRKSAGPDAVEALLAATGRDLAALGKKIEQLCLYAADRPRITRADVEAVGGAAATLGAFEIYDAIAAGRFETAYAAARRLLENGAAAHEILAALAFRLERTLKIRAMIERGDSPGRISGALRIHPYFLQKEIEDARRLGRGEGDLRLRAFGECDAAMKRGALEAGMALEKCLLELGQLEAARDP